MGQCIKNTGFFLVAILASAANIFPQQNESLAGTDSTSGRTLITETMLHPGESFTAYTYKKGEWFYGQNLVPYPGFAQFGATDWLTIELPFWEWLGGVASINLRFRITHQNGIRPTLAYETQYQYLANEVDLLENKADLKVLRKGNNWFNRINASWRLSKKLHLHLSAGATYAEYLSFENPDSADYQQETYKGGVSPDVSLGMDWRQARWISFHTTASYGSTYMYIDNTARKKQLTFATRIAPFASVKSRFLNSFRLELVYFVMQFGDVTPIIQSPFGFLYWQWQWQPRKK